MVFGVILVNDLMRNTNRVMPNIGAAPYKNIFSGFCSSYGQKRTQERLPIIPAILSVRKSLFRHLIASIACCSELYFSTELLQTIL